MCVAPLPRDEVGTYRLVFMRSIERQTFEQSNDGFPAFEETYGDRFG